MVRLGRVLVFVFVTSLFLVQAYSANALTKEEAQKQHTENEVAKQQAKANAHPAKPGTANIPVVKIIAIQLSNSCLVLVKNNITLNCPGYEDLLKYDTTKPIYSGKFIEKNSHLWRSSAGIKSVLYYDNSNYTVCVDCKHLPLSKFKQIIIVPSLDKYKKDSDKKVIDNTVYWYHSRGVNPNCQIATIKYDDFLLNDTITYLKTDCKVTQFDEKVMDKRPLTKHDISTTQAYKNQKWIEEAKKLATKNCLKSKEC